jgi:hypothetical protein
MNDFDMNFLRPVGIRGFWGTYLYIGNPAKFASILPGKCDDFHVLFHGDVYGFYNVARVSAGADCQQHITIVPKSFYISGKYMIIAIIIGGT